MQLKLRPAVAEEAEAAEEDKSIAIDSMRTNIKDL